MSTGIRPSHDFTNLWNRPGFLIRRLHQIHVAMFLDECRDFSITPVQFGVLTVLYGRDACDQVTISNQLGVDRVTVADVVRRLEKRALLERIASTADRRAKLARITEEGCAFVDAVQPRMIQAQRRFVLPLSEEENDVLMALLTKLMEANNGAGRAPLRTDG